MLKRYELTINRGRKVPQEHKIMRAVQISSLVGLAEDMLEQDDDICTITIMGPTYKEYEVVSR